MAVTPRVVDAATPDLGGAGLVEVTERERRRIGRELHDDIGQGLALLAIEVERLGRDPPATAAAVAAQAAGLAARVRDLSSAAHALSRQFHPACLEQFGLPAALRGLCRDLGRANGLEVTFTQRDVPAAVDPAAALCLYRVAQEALRNVTRHSGPAARGSN